MSKSIHITCFAVLRDHFPEPVTIPFEGAISPREIKARLAEVKPELSRVLDKSRLATSDEIIDGHPIFTEGAELLLFPPSSGG